MCAHHQALARPGPAGLLRRDRWSSWPRTRRPSRGRSTDPLECGHRSTRTTNTKRMSGSVQTKEAAPSKAVAELIWESRAELACRLESGAQAWKAGRKGLGVGGGMERDSCAAAEAGEGPLIASTVPVWPPESRIRVREDSYGPGTQLVEEWRPLNRRRGKLTVGEVRPRSPWRFSRQRSPLGPFLHSGR